MNFKTADEAIEDAFNWFKNTRKIIWYYPKYFMLTFIIRATTIKVCRNKILYPFYAQGFVEITFLLTS